MRLDNWYKMGNKLVGNVYNDEKGRFEDGLTIVTSAIVELNVEKGYVQTTNSKYDLGHPMDEGKPLNVGRETPDIFASAQKQFEFEFGKKDTQDADA